MNTLLANQSFVNSVIALIGTLATIGGAVAAYIKLRTAQAAQGAQLTALQKQTDTATTTTVVLPQQPAVAGGAALLRAPVWNQLNDVLPDNQQDPYATTDCGEESVAMTIAACGGPSLPAGVLRQCLGGALRQGLTSATDLVYLLKLFRIPAHVRFCPGDVAYQEWQHSFKAGYLVIALGWWVTDGYPHWILIRGITDASITFNDPWGGEVKTMLKADVMVKYKGEYVHVDSGVTDAAPQEVASA